ncbi:MAG: HAD family hydrolase [Promethearchaeota archaeon]|nr:MAG: HAD family hydrolase [Candidatus Lokiarchaeota archaeon]
MNEIKLVIFDFDQTLVDSPKGFDAAFIEIKPEIEILLQNRGVKINIEDYSDALRQRMRELDVQKIYNRDLWWNRLLTEVLKIGTIQFTPEECSHLTSIYWNTTIENTELYPDTLEILDFLKSKNYKLALLTDTDGIPGLKKVRLDKSPILSYIDGIMIAGDDVPQVKPDPTPFLQLASQLGTTPSEVVMVGDKPFTDIKGGKAAGFHTILILRENWQVDPIPDFQIRALVELKNLL